MSGIQLKCWRTSDVVYFIRIAVGCANPILLPGMWLRRDGDDAIVKCNSTGTTWKLHCATGSQEWKGTRLGNCSSTTSTEAVAVASEDSAWNVIHLFSTEAFPYSKLPRFIPCRNSYYKSGLVSCLLNSVAYSGLTIILTTISAKHSTGLYSGQSYSFCYPQPDL